MLRYAILLIVIILFTGEVSLDQNFTSESVSEGPCIPGIATRGAMNNRLSRFSVTPRNYFVPIASEAFFRNNAETLLGRPAKSQKELDSMKLRIRFRLLPPVYISSGFPNSTTGQIRRFYQSCPPVGPNQMMCIPWMGVNTRRRMSPSRDTLIYTDNKTTLLTVRCLNEKVKDYKVMSTTPTVTPETQEIITQKIKQLGFDPKLMRIKTY